MNESEKAVAEVLLKAKAVTPEQLEQAIRIKNTNGVRLEDALVKLKLCGEEQVAQATSKVSGIPFACRANNLLRPEKGAGLETLVDHVFAVDNMVLPLYIEDDTLYAAAAAPHGGVLGTALALKTGKPVSLFIAPATELAAALEGFYRGPGISPT